MMHSARARWRAVAIVQEETGAERKTPDATARRPGPALPPELKRLGDQIAELSARIDAATYDLLCHLRELDRRYGWEGFRSCAHWLNWRTGLDLMPMALPQFCAATRCGKMGA